MRREKRPRPTTGPVSGAASPLRIGQVLRLLCEDLAFGEDGVCRTGGYVVFVPRVLPGELVEVRITQAGRKYGRGEPVKIIRPSKDRVEPRCRHFGDCGGCTWQHLRYEAQAKAKEDLLRTLLRHRVSEAAASAVAPVAAMAEPWGFREKVQFAVQGRPGRPLVGFYRLRSHDVVDVTECPVQPPEAVARAMAVKAVLAARRVPPWDERTKRGAVRHIMLRGGRATGDAHLVLVTGRTEAPGLAPALRDFESIEPPLSGASLNLNDRETSIVLGRATEHVFGRKTWRERVGGILFEVGPTAFFQTNARAAETLVEEVRSAVGADSSAKVLDLYAGVGLFALTLAGRVGSVLAVEAHPAAAREGERNARGNGIRNCRWRSGPVERVVADRDLGHFDVVVADPPRDGLGPGVLEGILGGCRPRRLVLVSCDPLTLARDLALAERRGGRILRVLPVDMFPHTHHLEAVATVEFRAPAPPPRPRTGEARRGPKPGSGSRPHGDTRPPRSPRPPRRPPG